MSAQGHDGGEAEQSYNTAELAIDALLDDAQLAAAHELPGLVARHGAGFGAADALIYLVDLQQTTLLPFIASGGPAAGRQIDPLTVDGTLAGRAFQYVEVLTQSASDGSVRVWLPLLEGTDRLGVLAVTIAEAAAHDIANSALGSRLRRFAALVAELVMIKTMHADTIVRLHRQTDMSLAAELQWSLLPPLTFACREVTVAGALEPAYDVAGDTLDYAVDAGIARVAIFDGMGHGLSSAQLAAITVAGYRNARRRGCSLIDTAEAVHVALLQGSTGAAFSTGVLLELQTRTGLLSWVNAGHPEPLLFRGGKLIKALHCRPSLPFGLHLESEVDRRQVVVANEQLEPGDQILVYTDGVTEARSPDGDFFGEPRLIDLVVRELAAELPAPEMMRRVVRALLEHQQAQLSDDATLMLIEWRTSAPLGDSGQPRE
jgi:hypothetical protein